MRLSSVEKVIFLVVCSFHFCCCLIVVSVAGCCYCRCGKKSSHHFCQISIKHHTVISWVMIQSDACGARWVAQDGACFVCRFAYSYPNQSNVYLTYLTNGTVCGLAPVAVYLPSVQMLAPRRLCRSLVPLIRAKSSPLLRLPSMSNASCFIALLWFLRQFSSRSFFVLFFRVFLVFFGSSKQ